MNAIWKLPCIGIRRAESLQQTIDLENLVLGGWFSNIKQQQKPVNWLLYFVPLLKSPSKCFLRTYFSPRMAQGLLIADIFYSRCDIVVDSHPWLLPISIADPCSSSVNWRVSSPTFLMANWGLPGQILGPRSHRAPMAKLFLLCLSEVPWCQRHILFWLKPNGAEISVSDQKSYISQSSLLLLFFFFQTNFRPFSKNKWLKCHFSLWTFICSSFSRTSILWKGHKHRHNKILRLFPTISPQFRQTWSSVLHQCYLFHCKGLVSMPYFCLLS